MRKICGHRCKSNLEASSLWDHVQNLMTLEIIWLIGEPSYALEPLSELYKTVAGERPSIPSTCPKPLATFMESVRKLDWRPSNQSICNELRHMQGLLIAEDIAGASFLPSFIIWSA